MHKKKWLMASMIVVIVSVGFAVDARAQRPLERFQKRLRKSLPNGELMKKFRNNISGEKDKSKSDKNSKTNTNRTAQESTQKYGSNYSRSNADNRNTTNQAPRSKIFRTVQPQSARTQSATSAIQRSNSNYRSPSGSQSRTPNPATYQPTPAARQPEVAHSSSYPNPTKQSYRSSVKPKSQKIKNDYARKPPVANFDPEFDSKKAAKEFSNRGVYIRKTPRDGLLYESGIRAKDRIVGIGGIQVNDIKEIDEIAGVLGKGDQIEIVISRGGRLRQILATNGEIPTAEESAKSNVTKKLERTNDVFDPRPKSSRIPKERPAKDSIIDNSTESVLSGPAGSTRVNRSVTPNARTVSQMRQVIEMQQTQIKRLKNEVQSLRSRLNRSNNSSRRGGF